LLEKYAKVTQGVLDVVRENTAALVMVEKSIVGLPQFVQQVDARLAAGQKKFDEHDARLGSLEATRP